MNIQAYVGMLISSVGFLMEPTKVSSIIVYCGGVLIGWGLCVLISKD